MEKRLGREQEWKLLYKEARREGGGLAWGQWGGEDREGLATFAGGADRTGGLDVGFGTRESRVIPGLLI